jgi:hypothetical protein
LRGREDVVIIACTDSSAPVWDDAIVVSRADLSNFFSNGEVGDKVFKTILRLLKRGEMPHGTYWIMLRKHELDEFPYHKLVGGENDGENYLRSDSGWEVENEEEADEFGSFEPERYSL